MEQNSIGEMEVVYGRVGKGRSREWIEGSWTGGQGIFIL